MDRSGTNSTLSSSGSMGTQNAFNSQQSFQQSNMGNPGPSHMQGQQFPNVLDQQPRPRNPQAFLLNQQRLQQRSAPQNQGSIFNAANLRSQAPQNLFHRERIFQQQQQQHATRSLPPLQGSPAKNSFQGQNLPARAPFRTDYKLGMGAQRVMQYLSERSQRPQDNNINFWRKFVGEFYAPCAKKKWCLSMYGHQITGVLQQDTWQCEICNSRPGKGFEATVEVLPRLFKMMYESGTDERLSIDMPEESRNSSGQVVLFYSRAVQASMFHNTRVVRDGQLRIVLSPELKICLWEFCARSHEEFIPRRSLLPQVINDQVNNLEATAQSYLQASSDQAQNASSTPSISDLQSSSNALLASVNRVSKSMEVPLVNDIGYSKRFVRCLQTSQVLNSMKDLIDYSIQTGIGPMALFYPPLCLLSHQLSTSYFPRKHSSQWPYYYNSPTYSRMGKSFFISCSKTQPQQSSIPFDSVAPPLKTNLLSSKSIPNSIT